MSLVEQRPLFPGSTARFETHTPSSLTGLARAALEETLAYVQVTGEVTGWKRSSAGHCYFTLRDERAQIRCVMFQADAQRLPADPEEGMQVRLLGLATIYEPRGDFQLKVQALEAVGGDGLWRLAFERLRSRLEEEGLLAPERKRPLPRYPAAIGVVTSPVGAALHDIISGIGARAPWTRIVFSPARVQGEGSADEIAAAIRLLSASGRPDVVIVGRGGGSAEDLWAFNEEVVARAIVACPVPVISAVGHEVDVTIADLVADARAPTPTGAAELAVPDGAALGRELDALGARIRSALVSVARERKRELARLGAGLEQGASGALRRGRDRLSRSAATLRALSPLSSLSRGYAVPLDADGRVLRRARDFAVDRPFELRVVDCRVDCRVEEVRITDAPDGGGERDAGADSGR